MGRQVLPMEFAVAGEILEVQLAIRPPRHTGQAAVHYVQAVSALAMCVVHPAQTKRAIANHPLDALSCRRGLQGLYQKARPPVMVQGSCCMVQ